MQKVLLVVVILMGLAVASVLASAVGSANFGDPTDRDQVHANP